MVKRVALAADHAGFNLKEKMAAHLKGAGFEVMDLGTGNEEAVDYPDFALAIGEAFSRQLNSEEIKERCKKLSGLFKDPARRRFNG